MPLRLGRVPGGKLRGVGSHVVQTCSSLAERLWGAPSYDYKMLHAGYFFQKRPINCYLYPWDETLLKEEK